MILVLFEIAAAMRSAVGPAGLRRNTREDHAEIANIFRSPSAWRSIAKYRVDIALPKIGRLHDMHVAVEYSKSIFCHNQFFRDEPNAVALSLSS